MAKGAVCKTVMHRFKSGRRLGFEQFFQIVHFAEVAEMVDARDLKSLDPLDRAGSIPAFGTTIS